MSEAKESRFNEIYDAILRDEMFLEYLPTVVLTNRRCVGAEALIRWRRNGQVVRPLEFIPFVENTALAGLLTYWVIETVSRELGGWLERQTAGVHIGINVPPELLGRGGVEYAIKKSKLNRVAHKLVLEVSERGTIDKLGIQYLNDHVIRKELIALDDIQLHEVTSAMLSRVKVDIIKLDKEVVGQLMNKDDAEAVATIRALTMIPGLSIICEGVETEKQAARLQELDIEYAQGFLFSRPIAAQVFMKFFEDSLITT